MSPLLWYILVALPCIVVFIAGFWCILLRNRPDLFGLAALDNISGIRGRLLRWRARANAQTRLVVGFSLMLIGYHAAVWSDPLGRIEFCVPLDRWYMLAIGIIVAAAGTLLAERIESRDGKPPQNDAHIP